MTVSAPARAPSLDFEVLHLQPGAYGFGRVANVAVSVWARGATDASSRLLGRVTSDLVTAYPRGLSSIHWVKRGADLPSVEARTKFAEIIRSDGHLFGEVAVILDGDGFWAGAMRGMVTGLRLLAGKAGQMRVCASIDEVVTWLPDAHFRRTGVPVPAQHMVDALANLRARVGC